MSFNDSRRSVVEGAQRSERMRTGGAVDGERRERGGSRDPEMDWNCSWEPMSRVERVKR